MKAEYRYEYRMGWFYVYNPDGTPYDSKAMTREAARQKVYELNGWDKKKPTTGRLLFNSPSGQVIELETGKFSALQSALKGYIQRGYAKERLKVTY